MDSQSTILLFALGCLSAGAAASLIAPSAKLARLLGNGSALIGSLAGLVFALAGLGGSSFQLQLPQLLPLGGLSLGLDRLSAFFVTLICLGAAPAALYAIGYTRHYKSRGTTAALGSAFNIFLAAMMLVPLARNAVTFLILWELMSLASYLLVVTEHEHQQNVNAAWIYFVMTHAGFAALMMGFLLLAQAAGSGEFSDWSAAGAIDSHLRNIIFALLAVGFGSKAGIIPLHIWLPRAHPAAPSHVSALMSGVMIKLGVYGFVRMAFDWLGAGPLWWGGALLVLGGVSGVLAALYALVEADLKRVLAYSSIENVGIIMLGTGAAMLFQASQLPGLAALALLAALYHTLNHAVFKTLLFMAAGAVLQATGTRNLEELGGLIKRMPQTALLFLSGSLAIAGLPPFNGFVSEWLTFQALLLSFKAPAQSVSLTFALGIAALALISGLAAAGFVRAFGIAFLALPRSAAAEQAREADSRMRVAMALLALLCVLLGVLPAPVLAALTASIFDLTGARAELHADFATLITNGGFGRVAPLWIALGLAAVLAGLALMLRALASKSRRCYETWGCGRALQTARFEYTATAFANPFKRVFALLYQPTATLEIGAAESRYFVRTISYRQHSRLLFEEALYRPILQIIQGAARQARVLQSGNVHSYLMYILITLIGLLLLAV